MAYLAPIHKPSSVRHALKIRFLDPNEESLIIAKANRIEIYSHTDDGLTLSYTRALYGKVTMLERLQPPQSSTEHLFVGTDRQMYFTLSWDAQEQQFHTERSFVDQADPTTRDSQIQDPCLIDPTRQFMALQLFDGIITVLPLAAKGKKKGPSEATTLGEPIPSRITEFLVRSSAFLHLPNRNDGRPQIALLYEDNHQKTCLSVKTLNFSAGMSGEAGTASFDDVDKPREDLELGASLLIPVPGPACGLLVLAETSISYLNKPPLGRSLTEPLKETAIFVAWTQVDQQRWLMADDYGNLYFFMLLLENDEVSGWKLDKIGLTSRASVLVYLDPGIVFVGSHQGDSQLVRIQDHSIEVLQTLSNVAPILDFTIMDLGNRSGEARTNEYSSGQARIVTGSGAFHDGSLRSIRSGVGLEEQGLLGEMKHITDLFALRSAVASKYEDVLIASFVDETRVFRFSADGEVEEQRNYNGLLMSEETLLVSNVLDNNLLQVTRSKVHLLEMEGGMIMAQWSAPNEQAITATSAGNRKIALSVAGSEIVILDLDRDLQLTARRPFFEEGQISCIHLPSVPRDVCIAGFWQSASIAVLEATSLEILHKVTMSEDSVSVPRSLLLAQILEDQQPTLFVAMANGEVVTFAMDIENVSLSTRKTTILGTQQANLKALPREDGLVNVFATCEHPSLIYGAGNRIVYSAVTAEEASCVCPFNSKAYPESVAIATAEDLRIALVDTERTTHVQTLKVSETVRRVAYSAKLKAFGLGTIHRSLRGSHEVIQSSFKLADEVFFKELDTYALDEDELVESVIRADLQEPSGDSVERFVVGTSYVGEEQSGSERGRIIVFAATSERKLQVVAQLTVKGACRVLGVVCGRIVAGLVKVVVVYSLNTPSLTKQATYRTSTAPIDISVHGSLVAIADLMKSISIVQYTRGTAGTSDELKEIARHFQTAWSTAVAYVDDHTWLESEAEGNLMILQHNVSGVTAEDRRRLERVDGSIYLFALIVPSKQNLLMRLQQAIAARVQSPGHVPFNRYRAFKSSVREEEEPFRFVDGELVEKFVDCPPMVQEEICEELVSGGMNVEVEEVRELVEGLRRLR
ncbi:MAG: hypothetical protein LQ342_000857 [Letrouitia transgressa]|nr:MAG: hypothetical protein LQ342_000857 [Letrouitia transgressa]